METFIAPEETAFLQAIAQQADDAVTRRVYADWLEDRGEQLRATILRAEVAAAAILGWPNVHGILEVERFFGVRFRPAEMRALAVLPFTPRTLRACRKTHL